MSKFNVNPFSTLTGDEIEMFLLRTARDILASPQEEEERGLNLGYDYDAGAWYYVTSRSKTLIRERLAAAGFRELGAGHYSVVFSHVNAPRGRVYKLSPHNEDNWREYAAWLQGQTHPNLPRCYRVLAIDVTTVSVMESLSEFKHDADRPGMRARKQQAWDAVLPLFSQYDMYPNDGHDGNWMIRNSTGDIVLNDPGYGDSVSPKYHQHKESYAPSSQPEPPRDPDARRIIHFADIAAQRGRVLRAAPVAQATIVRREVFDAAAAASVLGVVDPIFGVEHG